MENNLNNFEQDLLNRKPLAENLINIIQKSNDINVIAIDSAWGTGKTTFIKMWENMINTDERYKDKFETLYFNAWENDYIKDPLLAFISEISKQLKKDDNKVKKGLNHIKEYGKKLLKPLTVTGVRLLTHGILDLEKIKFEKFTEDEITKLMGNISEISLQEIVKDKETRSEFISELKNYIEKNNTNMIFFIDELDRCRPLFAIELLEVIKHLFNITGITFIISVDKEQLSHSISTLYGQNMDSDGYLRRFFDLEYKMPITNKEIYVDFKNKLIFNGYKNTKYLETFIKELIIRDKFSFRDINKTYEYIKLLLPTFDVFHEECINKYEDIYILTHSYILSQMIDIKIKHSNVYNRIINLNYNSVDEEIDNMLNFNEVEYMRLDSEEYKNNILKETIKPIMIMYLKLVKLSCNGKENVKIIERDKEKFTVLYKDSTGRINYEHGILRMWLVISNKKFDFINKMEFLDNFNTL